MTASEDNPYHELWQRWRAQPKGLRTWVFASVMWAILSFAFLLICDPFYTGSLSYMSGREWGQFSFVALAPALCGILRALYLRIAA